MKDFTVFISILLKSKKADVEFTYADGKVDLFRSSDEIFKCLVSYDMDHIMFYINTGSRIELREDRFLIHTADWEKSKATGSYLVESMLWDISDLDIDFDKESFSFDVDGDNIEKVKIKWYPREN